MVEWALIFAVVLALGMVIVIWLDATTYVIPNALNLFLLGAYPFAAYLLGLDWMMAAVAGAIALGIGMGIFALGFMGGGDIKLLAVLVVWTGWTRTTVDFLFTTALFGGALVVVVLIARFILPGLWRGRALPRLMTAKQPVPYGIAIALAFLLVLARGAVPGLTVTF